MNHLWALSIGSGLLLLAAVILVLRDWPGTVRVTRILWFIKGRVFVAFCAVYILGGFPIGAHLFASLTNEQDANRGGGFWRVFVPDVYLYAFIISIAGLVEALSIEASDLAFVFVVLAFITGFGNYNGMLDAVSQYPVVKVIATPMWLILLVTVVGYGWFKAFRLYGAGNRRLGQGARAGKNRLTPKGAITHMSTLNFFSAVASAFGAVFAAIQFARLLGEKRNRDTLIAQIRA